MDVVDVVNPADPADFFLGFYRSSRPCRPWAKPGTFVLTAEFDSWFQAARKNVFRQVQNKRAAVGLQGNPALNRTVFRVCDDPHG